MQDLYHPPYVSDTGLSDQCRAAQAHDSISLHGDPLLGAVLHARADLTTPNPRD